MAKSKWILLLLVSVLLQTAVFAETETPSDSTKPLVVPNTALALPEDCKLKIRWVCPPLDTDAVEKSLWYSLFFTVDADGRPWLSYQNKGLVCPVRQYQFRMPSQTSSIACLDQGTFFVATKADLGFVVPPSKLEINYDKIPLAVFQPIAELPVTECTLFAGAGSCLYLVGERKDGGSDVFLLQSDQKGIHRYLKVFTSKENSVLAVTGDGTSTFIALGRTIFKVAGSGGELTRLYTDPNETIRYLAYQPGTGLFFATSSGISFMGAKGHLQLIATPDPRICLRKGSLYVLLSKSFGVLALDGIDDLKRFDRAVKEVPVNELETVKLSSVRFFEAGDETPEPDDRKFASEFDEKTTRYVYCQVDLENLQHEKLRQKHTVHISLYQTGQEDALQSSDINFDVKPDFTSMWGWARFGSNDPGGFYPCDYKVKISLDGTLLNESSFKITGQPSLLMAAGHHDAAMVGKLIKEGANVDDTTTKGYTPLMLGVITADVPIVKLLLDSGAKVNVKNSEGDTPLTLDGETWKDDPTVAKLLLAAGAEINAQGKEGQTALYKAVYKGKASVVRLLLDHGANPNITDKNNLPAMLADGYVAEEEKMAEIMDLLISHGVDPNTKDNDGKTALFAAIDRRRSMLVSALIKRGADVNATCKFYGVEELSVLGYALQQYAVFRDERGDRDRLLQIAGILQQNGAQLNTSEFKSAYFPGVEQFFDSSHMIRLFEMSEAAAEACQSDNISYRKAALRGLLNAACRKISDSGDEDGYYQVLNLLEEAGKRARKWGLYASYSEIVFNAGMVWMTVGSSDNAKKCYQESLDTAPTGPCAVKARELLKQIK